MAASAGGQEFAPGAPVRRTWMPVRPFLTSTVDCCATAIFATELSLATTGPMSGASQKGEFIVRSAILIFLATLAFATTSARAQGRWLETRMIRAICSSKATLPANPDRLAKRLELTDPQKVALKDLSDASASAEDLAKTSLCADKTDLSTTPGRMAFAEKMGETKLAGLKAVEPKLQAFYDSLDTRPNSVS